MRMVVRKITFACVLFLLMGSCAHAQTALPRPQGYVSDFAGTLSAGERARIEAVSLQLKQKTGAEIAVVTVPSVRPLTIEQYAVQLFQEWGIGERGKDNGVLFLTAINDRDVRIEVGYGLEGALTDALSRSIIERFIIPAFRQGAYSQGIEAGTMAIVSVVAREYDVTITGEEARVHQVLHRQESGGSPIVSFIIFAVLMILFIKNPRLFFFFMMMSMMGGGRRSGYGGSFGGGFGGFGGGMSGGGGASGRW